MFDPVLPNVNADFKGRQASQRQQKQQNVKNVESKESSKNETSKVSSKLKSKPVEYSSTKEHGNEKLSPTISKTKNVTVNKKAAQEKELDTSSLQRGASKSSKLGEDRRNSSSQLRTPDTRKQFSMIETGISTIAKHKQDKTKKVSSNKESDEECAPLTGKSQRDDVNKKTKKLFRIESSEEDLSSDYLQSGTCKKIENVSAQRGSRQQYEKKQYAVANSKSSETEIVQRNEENSSNESESGSCEENEKFSTPHKRIHHHGINQDIPAKSQLSSLSISSSSSQQRASVRGAYLINNKQAAYLCNSTKYSKSSSSALLSSVSQSIEKEMKTVNENGYPNQRLMVSKSFSKSGKSQQNSTKSAWKRLYRLPSSEEDSSDSRSETCELSEKSSPLHKQNQHHQAKQDITSVSQCSSSSKSRSSNHQCSMGDDQDLNNNELDGGKKHYQVDENNDSTASTDDLFSPANNTKKHTRNKSVGQFSILSQLIIIENYYFISL